MIKISKRKSAKKGSKLNSNIQPLISNQNGITLIALIITIIVMLILVGVSISIAIKGDLFGITKSGAKQTQIEAYREQLEAIRVTAMMEQIKDDLTTLEFLDKVEEGIRANSTFNGSEIKKTAKSVKITTKEGYVFKITENKVTYMGLASEQGELTLDLTEANTDFIYNPSGWTRGKVKVSIETRVDAEELGAVLEYSTDGNTWEEYTSPIELTNNGDKIYARLYNEEEEEVGSVVTGTVKNIDRLSPKQFEIAGTSTESSITITGSTTDREETQTDGSSEISKYYYSKDDGQTWEPQNGTVETSYTFEDLEDGKTYGGLKMKAVDNAGNEIVTEAITVATKKIPKPEIGDYVDYQPDTVTASYELLGKYSGYTNDKEIPQDTLNWQVLKMHKDGSIDLIGTPTNTRVYLNGALGYNNGVYILNDICKELYSKPSAGIEARSINLEDFEDEENGGNWKAVRDEYEEYGVKYNGTKKYIGTHSYYPNIYATENGSGINTSTTKTDGIESSDYSTLTEETYSQATENGLTVTQTYYSISINEENYGKAANALVWNDFYWIASRYVECYTQNALFGLIRGGSRFDTLTLCSSGNSSNNVYGKLRPVITLKSGIKLELSEEGTNSPANPHKIVNY